MEATGLPAGGVSRTEGAKAAYGQLTHHVIGRNPKTWGVIVIAMIVLLLLFIVLWIVYLNKYKDCAGKHDGFLGTDPLGNMNTGGNNPMWNLQSGPAGWGGPMHSTYPPGEGRVWGASAEGGNTMAVVPGSRTSVLASLAAWRTTSARPSSPPRPSTSTTPARLP